MNDTLKLVRSLVTEPKIAFIVSNIKNVLGRYEENVPDICSLPTIQSLI